MSKLKTIPELQKINKKLRNEGKTIGMITGCFDILHMDHVRLFRFAKKRVDILIVGLDNDTSIALSKGKGRPIFKLRERAGMLSEIESIDFIFGIEDVIDFKSRSASSIHKNITAKLHPNALITNPFADTYWKEKQQRARKYKIALYLWKKRRTTSSSELATRLYSEL